MPRKKEPPIKEIPGTYPAISLIFANVVGVGAQVEVVVLDFGFVTRNYSEPYDIEDKQVASICMTWDSIKDLNKSLRLALEDHSKELASKRPPKTKK